MAAAPDELMPPFPEPTHLVKQFDRTVQNVARLTDVGFTSEAAVARAHDPVLLADLFDDLPAVSNISYQENHFYSAPPQSPYQVRIFRRIFRLGSSSTIKYDFLRYSGCKHERGCRGKRT